MHSSDKGFLVVVFVMIYTFQIHKGTAQESILLHNNITQDKAVEETPAPSETLQNNTPKPKERMESGRPPLIKNNNKSYEVKIISSKEINNQTLKDAVHQLYNQIKSPVTLAILPLERKALEIPKDFAKQVENAFIAGLALYKPSHIQLMDRQSIDKIWKELSEFGGGINYKNNKFGKFLTDVGADAIVTGSLEATETHVVIAFKIIRVRKIAKIGGAPGTILGVSVPIKIPYNFKYIANYSPVRATFIAMRRLSPVMRDIGVVSLIAQPFSQARLSTRSRIKQTFPFYLANLFSERANLHLAQNRGHRSLGSAPAGQTAKHFIKVTYEDIGEAIEAKFHLFQGHVKITSVTVRIDPFLIPGSYRQRKIENRTSTNTQNRYDAQAVAILGATLSRAEAYLGAKTLARIQAVFAARGLNPAMLPQQIRKPKQIVQLLKHLSKGIPYDEKWSEQHNSSGQIVMILNCKVKQSSYANTPPVKGNFQTQKMYVGDQIILNLKAKRNVRIALFWWQQPKGEVMSVYPSPRTNIVTLSSGMTRLFPKKSDKINIALGALEGVKTYHEAMIVIASESKKFDFHKLMPQNAHFNQTLYPQHDFFKRLSENITDQEYVLVYPFAVDTPEKKNDDFGLQKIEQDTKSKSAPPITPKLK